jgi:poly(3-hydroxybutyrate) depolymerase
MRVILGRAAALGALGIGSAACASDDGSSDPACTGAECGAGGTAGSASGGGGSSGGGAAGTAGTPGTIPIGTCADEPPPGAEQAPDPPSYSGGACPTLTPGTAYNVISTSGQDRQFVLLAPDNPQPGETFPLAFMWHWLSGTGEQFAGIIGGQQTANETRTIMVFPTGVDAIPANWPWSSANNTDPTLLPRGLLLFDDILACVSEQFPVDKNCVSSVGVSDGALWTSQLAGQRGQYLSSILVLSGGVGPDPNGLLLPWTPSPHAMPALALWGGTTDVFAVVMFDQAMRNLEAGLQQGGHFVVECIHNCGHGVPPLEPVEGQSLFTPLFRFVTDHPYWLPDGVSPYTTEGLPLGMPPWCAIGVGNAIARTDPCQ